MGQKSVIMEEFPTNLSAKTTMKHCLIYHTSPRQDVLCLVEPVREILCYLDWLVEMCPG